MENNEDLKEDLLQSIEDLSTRLTGTERQTFAKKIIHSAAYWGTQSHDWCGHAEEEAKIILQAATMDFYGGCKVQGDLNLFSLN